MKILFLANRIPYPPYRGDKLKIYNLAGKLRERHELHLLTFAQTKEEMQYAAELEKVFTRVHIVYLPKWRSALNCVAGLWNSTPFQVLYFRSAAMRRALQAVLQANQFDAVHVQHLRMAQYLSEYRLVPRILDLPDAFSLYWARRQRMARSRIRSLFEEEEQKRVLHYEEILAAYDMALVCSTEDRDYLRQQHHLSHIHLLPNGVDLNTFDPGPAGHDYTRSGTVLFTGNMDYAPNVDAVTHFAAHIFPELRRRFPGIRFVIAGQRPVKKVLDLAAADIEITGFVKDLSEMYARASVLVAPLRFGAGTQNKVLEAMAMGLPVVSTAIGFRGLGIESGEGVFMETDDEAFTLRVAGLLESEALRRSVGLQGREVIRSRFSWDIIAGQLEHYFRQLLVR